MARHDLTVVGGGIMGLSCAWEATGRGLRVHLVERRTIGAGASGGLVGALAPHAPDQWTPGKAFQLQALLMAEAHWAEVQEASGLSPGYARSGRLQPIPDAAALALARSREDQAAALWQGRAQWRVIPSGAAFAPASPTGYLIHDTLTARLNPRQALASLTRALQVRGATVTLGEEPAADLGPQGKQAPVIWATGHWGLADLSTHMGRKIGQGVKGQALLLHLPGFETHPQVYADGLYIVPHGDGSVAIGSTSENTYAHEDTDSQADALLAKARALLPELQAAPEITRWSGIRPRAQSRQPLLGPWPGRPGHFIANGGFKIGFAVAPLCAKLLLDAIEGKDAIPDAFRP